MTMLSLDPGKKVGRAMWGADGTLLFNDEVSVNELIAFLANARSVKTVVVESWMLLRRATSQIGSKMEASQVIGAAKLFALMQGAEYVEQPPSILPVSALHAGVALPKGHTPDKLSAYLHGHYYLVCQGVIQPHQITID